MRRSSHRWRARIAPAANFRCGYCLTQEVVSGVPLTLEHIVPVAKGGTGQEANLWLSCRSCNEAKGTLTEYPEPQTGELTLLFNPRTQDWATHFVWSVDGTQIIGITPIGRATVEALDLNHEFRRRSRAIWVEAGWHPPV